MTSKPNGGARMRIQVRIGLIAAMILLSGIAFWLGPFYGWLCVSDLAVTSFFCWLTGPIRDGKPDRRPH